MKKFKRDLTSCRSRFAFNFRPLLKLNLLFLCLTSLQSFAGSTNDNAPVNSSIEKKEKFTGRFALTVSGKIVDDKGVPLSGATVQERGTKNSTVTKADGSF